MFSIYATTVWLKMLVSYDHSCQWHQLTYFYIKNHSSEESVRQVQMKAHAAKQQTCARQHY